MVDKPNMLQHWTAAETALVNAAKPGITNPTRQAWALIASAELAACDLVLRYPEVSFGPLP